MDSGQKRKALLMTNKLATLGLSLLMPLSSTAVFGQKSYNDHCNGSLAWLSSTTETRGALNPAAVIADGVTSYYGINQLNGYNVFRLIQFIDSHDEYKSLQGKLSVTVSHGINKRGEKTTIYKADNNKWRTLANTQREAFTEAQENFLCQVYLPECFLRLQKSLISHSKISGSKLIVLSELHPAVLSLFARSYVKGPFASAPLTALKKVKNVNEVNTEQFIMTYTKNKPYLQNNALNAFRDTTISWKDAQLKAACSLAVNEVSHLRECQPVSAVQKSPSVIQMVKLRSGKGL